MPGLAQRNDHQLSNGSGSDSGHGFWSNHNNGICHNQLQKFWNERSPQERQVLLRIDKQTLFEQARKNMYCSRCNGLLLEGFLQIVMYGKSLQQEGTGPHHPCSGIKALKNQCDGGLCVTTGCEDNIQDPSVHPWGGLTTTRDGALTLLDCYIYTKSLKGLQNVFDSARARERERELLYPDACGGGGRGWISQGMASYGRGHGTRETCALHTARLSVDTLVDFWSALGEETRLSLLRMKEEDFIERLLYRFDSKRFCRDCRRNVIREFKELKELKRMRREPRCTSWFCVADTAFQYEVSHDTIQADWHQTFTDTFGTYHHFEWAVGTGEGKCDILDYENVGLGVRVQVNGLDLGGLNACYITLRAWKMDGRCTELSVKAHALKGQQCVHCRLVVGDGFVTITRGESIRRFFEHAEEAEEEEDDDSMDKDGNDLDGECSRPQKHAKSPELAREFLLDAATVIFKEQVEKAFREGTARQNAHSIFVCLALKLLEERVHVACKEIITLEKQMKLLEEEEKEKREEEERKERRRIKEKEKKLRRKERLREKDREKKGFELNQTNSVHDDIEEEIWKKERSRERENDIEKKSCESNQTAVGHDVPKEETIYSIDDESNLMSNRGSLSEMGETNQSSPLSPDNEYDLFLDGYRRSNMQIYSDDSLEGFNSKDVTILSSNDHSRYSRRRLRFRNDFQPDSSPKGFDRRRFAVVSESGGGGVVNKYDPRHYCDSTEASRSTNRLDKQVRNNGAKSNIKNSAFKFAEKFQCSNNKRMNGRYDSVACSCNQHIDYRPKLDPNMAREMRGNKPVSRSGSSSDFSKPYYHGNKYNQREYVRENDARLKNRMTTGNNLSSRDSPVTKKVWEPMESQKKYPRSSSDSDVTLSTETLEDPEYSTSNSLEVSSPPQICHEEKDVQESRKSSSKTESNCRKGYHLEDRSQHYLKNLGADDENELMQGCFLGSSQSSSNSDNCSSCLSEGDSNTSFSNPRHPESSSTSDSEDSSQKSEGRGTSEIRNGFADCSGVGQQKENATDRYVEVKCLTPDSAGTTTVRSFPVTVNSTCSNGNLSVNSHGTQPQPVHPPVQNQGIPYPMFQAPAMGYYYQNPPSWGAAPVNGLMPLPHPNHYVYASPFAYGLNANTHFMQYGGLQHLTHPVVNPGHFPVYQQVAQINDNCTKGSGDATTIGGIKDAHHEANMQRMAGQHTTDKPTVEAGQNEKSGSAGFSLFSFTPDPFSLKQGIARNISSNSIADHTEGDGGCIKKDPIEEYNPFANRIEFPFSDIVC